MEGSCGQFRSNKIVNYNDVYWRQNNENCGRNDRAKVFRPYRRGYHGEADILFSPPQTVGGSRYRPYGTLPNHHYTPIYNNIHQPIQAQWPIYGSQATPYYPPVESYYQRRDRYVQAVHMLQNPSKLCNTARRLDLGHVTDRPQQENTSVSYPRPKLESYRTRDSRIRTGVDKKYPTEQRVFSEISHKQSPDVLSTTQIELKTQEAWSETNHIKKQDANGDNLNKLGIKRIRPVSTSPTNSPVCKRAAQDPRPKLESYRTRDSRIRTGVENKYPTEQRIFSEISHKQSPDVLSTTQIELKTQEAWSETNSIKKQDANSDNRKKLGIKRIRPVSNSPTNSPVCKRAAQDPSPANDVPIMSKYTKEKHSQKPLIISTLEEVVIPEISQYDLKPEYTEEGESIYLGQGNYGYVVRAKLLQEEDEEKIDVAAKYFRPKLNTKKTVLKEARIQKYLEDTGTVPKVHGLVNLPHKDDLPVLVQECVCEGNTAEDMMAKGGSKLTWLKFCCEAAKGLQKIHQRHVLLNDIKCDNILIENKDNSLAVKFVDFGLASFKSSFVSIKSESEMTQCHHIAPEVKKQAPSTILSDIFSLGYVISHIGKKNKHYFIETLGKLLTASDPSLRFSLAEFIPFVEDIVINEEMADA